MYLEKKPHAFGLKEETVILEAGKVMITIRLAVEDMGMLSSMPQSQLTKLLSMYDYKSGHVSERLAADFVREWVTRWGRKKREELLLWEMMRRMWRLLKIIIMVRSQPPSEIMRGLPSDASTYRLRVRQRGAGQAHGGGVNHLWVHQPSDVIVRGVPVPELPQKF